MQLPLIDSVTAKFDALRQRLRIVPTHSVLVDQCIGQVLGQRLFSFRDSPAVDVSAMDGYALRLQDAALGRIPVQGIASAGAQPLECAAGQAIRIFTGGAVPAGADCVVPREQCVEATNHVEINVPVDSIRAGQHIRRRGENGPKGALILERGTLLNGPAICSLVSLSQEDRVEVFDPVRISLLNTGDELVELGQPIQDWQIRDSNGPLLATMLARQAWARVHRRKVPDDPVQIREALSQALAESDAVILTGGVSMGDTDHVPKSIVDCGGEVVFHRVPIRPGKPLLGAVGPKGQLIMGLPGNPVSVAVTFRRYALPLLRHIAGMRGEEIAARIPLLCDDAKTLELIWFRLVKLDGSGNAMVLPSQGSGDIISLSNSDGFVEIPPGVLPKGSFPFYSWQDSIGFT